MRSDEYFYFKHKLRMHLFTFSLAALVMSFIRSNLIYVVCTEMVRPIRLAWKLMKRQVIQ
jgi:hypothetical protein